MDLANDDLNNVDDGAIFVKKILVLQGFYIAKSVFLPVNASLRWLNNVSCLFLSFMLITSGVYLCIAACSTMSSWLCFYCFPPGGLAKKICRILQPREARTREMSQTLLNNDEQGNLD